ncbi:unnamed protein product [Soboliphyme baturini]|uniref:RIH_assoc domain-containing protein n=1 Tax=Soboliphyme baturini TaxID=241478 RepID=A0A183IP21_9BILA|nr:unnamed protein product [Soboliphyme baturini]
MLMPWGNATSHYFEIFVCRLLALCTAGKNGTTELQCASLIPLEHVVSVLGSKHCPYEVKDAYVKFVLHCYIDTDADMKDMYCDDCIVYIFEDIWKDTEKLFAYGSSENEVAVKYLCMSASKLVSVFFEKPGAEYVVNVKNDDSILGKLLDAFGRLQSAPWLTELNANYKYYLMDCVEVLCRCATDKRMSLPANVVMPPEKLSSKWKKYKKVNLFVTKTAKASLKTPDNANVVDFFHAKELRSALLMKFFGTKYLTHFDGFITETVPDKAEAWSLGSQDPISRAIVNVQNCLNSAGATRLVIKLIVQNGSDKVFCEAVQLAIALLEGGNNLVQNTFYETMQTSDLSENFFRILYEKIGLAQNKLKSTMMNSSNESGVGSHGRKASSLSSASSLHNLMDDAARKANEQLKKMDDEETQSYDTEQQDDFFITPAMGLECIQSDFLPYEIAIMEPLLRMLQLLCENHNHNLQVIINCTMSLIE